MAEHLIENEQEQENKKIKPFPIRNISIVLSITIILVFMFIPKMVTEFSWITLNTNKPNEIGDTIGGILGPVIGLIGAILTFLAFWTQYEANIEQRFQFNTALENEKKANILAENIRKNEDAEKVLRYNKEQARFVESQKLQESKLIIDDLRTRTNLFETRFYNMLTIHRDNVKNIEIPDLKGQNVFVHLISELKLMHELCEGYNSVFDLKINDKKVFNIAYLTFFFGYKSKSIINDLITEDVIQLVRTLNSQIDYHKENYTVKGGCVDFLVDDKHFKFDNSSIFGIGHMSRLSHYIRHLFQIVKFVDEQPKDLLKEEQKYEYISNLRSQLTIHEQLLLFYNSISVLGKPWLDKIKMNEENYIEKYCLSKSIPKDMADFYKKPSDFFNEKNKSGRIMFESYEIKKRMEELS
jgi:hypothetical protein